VNVWLAVAAVLVVALVPLAAVAVTRPMVDGLVALQVGGTLTSAAMLLIAEGTNREPFGDLALVLGAVSFIGTVAFLRFVERVR
jgi:multisubunit Na+/H+ antiporter MnhF subunit